MISLSLSNLIKNFLNIQDNNISFPEKEYCQVIQKDNYLVKVFKGFLKSNYCTCLHCNSKNIVKNIDGAMSFVFADFQSKSIIDIVEDRGLHSLTEFFSIFSLEARNNVKYICMDMYVPYISLVNSIFPNAKIVIDKFHIVNFVNRAFNQTRISIMNSIQDDSLKRKLKLFMFESNTTNGLIEGLNNKIKSIKKTAFGYSNFSNFKKRVLIQEVIIPISA